MSKDNLHDTSLGVNKLMEADIKDHVEKLIALTSKIEKISSNNLREIASSKKEYQKIQE